MRVHIFKLWRMIYEDMVDHRSCAHNLRLPYTSRGVSHASDIARLV